MEEVLGRVVELWRYPVKSLGGERLEEVACRARGLEGDRCLAVAGSDGKLGSGKTTRRFRRMPGLLLLSSFTDPSGEVWVRFPDGECARAAEPGTAARIGAVVGEEVSLVEEAAVSHFDDAPLHLVTTSSLAWLERLRPADGIDVRRMRPNLLVETEGEGHLEESWLGASLRVGGATLEVVSRTERCVMTTMAQGPLGFAPGILRQLTASSDACLGVYAAVVGDGVVRLGDAVVGGAALSPARR